MKYIKNIGFIILVLLNYGIQSQCLTTSEPYLYAAPIEDGGSELNDGLTYETPVDLQTGLDMIQPGYTLWLLGGTYNGRYHTKFTSNEATETCPITISSYPGEWARLNGNAECESIVIGPLSDSCKFILVVNKPYMHFKDFEITLVDGPGDSDNFSRYKPDDEEPEHPLEFPYLGISGIAHHAGIYCEFINLVIRNMTGMGIESSHSTGGAKVYGCLIYNTGSQLDGGFTLGTGAYIRNATDSYKNFNNNIFFNNFKAGAKLWSDTEVGAPQELLQNVNFKHNVFLNTGSPLYTSAGKECLTIGGTSIEDGKSVLHHVNIERNFIFHNFGPLNGNNFEALKIGHENNIDNNYAYEINILDNYILGRNHGIRFQKVGEIDFKRNLCSSSYMYSKYNYSTMSPLNWHFGDNKYFTKYSPTDNAPWNTLYYMLPGGASTKRTLEQMELPISDGGEYEIENGTSEHQHIGWSSNNLKDALHEIQVLSIVQNAYNPNVFKIVVFDKEEQDVTVNLSSYSIPNGTTYTVRDAENYFEVLTEPEFIINAAGDITLPMDLSTLDKPNGAYPAKGTVTPKKTTAQVGVFIIEFDKLVCIPDYVLQNITENSDIEYLASNSISTAGSSTFYNTSVGTNVLHQAGKLVHLKPGTHIKSGTVYHALIEDCSISKLKYIGESENTKPKSIAAKETSINDSEAVKIFPNPTSGDVSIKSTEAIVIWELHDQFGALLSKDEATHISQKNAELDLNTYPKGIYFLKVTLQSGETITKQIIKK